MQSKLHFVWYHIGLYCLYTVSAAMGLFHSPRSKTGSFDQLCKTTSAVACMNDNTCSTGLLNVVGVATVMRQLKRICPRLLMFLLEKYSDGFHFIFNVIGFIIVQCLLWFFSNLIYIYSITVLRPGVYVIFKMVKPFLLNNSRMKNMNIFEQLKFDLTRDDRKVR